MVIKIKKINIMILSMIFLCFLSACDTDSHQGIRPLDYENSIWSSDNPVVYIEYKDNGVLRDAYLMEDGEYIYIDILYGTFDNSVLILDVNENALLRCNAVFSSNLCILTIVEHVDGTFLNYTTISLHLSS